MAVRSGPGSLERETRAPIPRLHLITDRQLARSRSLAATVALAVAGGVDAVHLREKDLGAGALLALALELRRAVPGIHLLVNDRVDVAIAAGADGVQLPGSGLRVDVARSILGAGALIGFSAHSVAAAREADNMGVDFILLGTIFATGSKPGREPAGVRLIQAVRAEVAAPVIAIGGITAGNAALALRAGAYGIAVRAALLAASDPRFVAQRLSEVIMFEAS